MIRSPHPAISRLSRGLEVTCVHPRHPTVTLVMFRPSKLAESVAPTWSLADGLPLFFDQTGWWLLLGTLVADVARAW